MAQFMAARRNATNLAKAAKGSGAESDIRARALVAMAELTTIRNSTALALADLDQIEAKAAAEFVSLDAIHSAQKRIEALVIMQDGVLEILRSEIDG